MLWWVTFGLVAAISFAMLKFFTSKQLDSLDLPSVEESDIPQYSKTLQFTPHLDDGSATQVRIGSNHVFWKISPGKWKVLEFSELAGCKIDKQIGKTTKVTLYAWCSRKRPIFKGNTKNTKKTKKRKQKRSPNKKSFVLTIQHTAGWIFEMISVLTWQIARLCGSIFVGSDAKKRLIPVVENFHFNERKIEALRMHRILAHCCLHKHEEIIEKSLQNVTYIPDSPPKRRALCIINPKSGNSDAENIMKDLQPFIEASSELIEFTIQCTTHAFHAKEIGRDFEENEFDIIICVGGDGIPYEVVNGIMSRENGQEIINKIAIGIIPAGTGNGITASLGIQSPQDSMLRIIHGNVKPFDVMLITQEDNPQLGTVYSLLQVSYGMMSDIDFESERLRFCGDLRFTIVAFYRLIFLRKYPVDIIFKGVARKDVVDPNKTVVWTQLSEEESNIELNTKTIWCGGMNTSWLAADFNCAPSARIDDGLIHFLHLPYMGKVSLFTFFFEMNSGKHMRYPFFFYRTKAFTIVPHGYPGVPPRLDVDGECVPILELKPVNVHSSPGLCRMIV